MPGRPCSLIVASLLLALVASACAREEARSVTCHTHKVGNGELIECR
ncbi:hypothetical protein [Bosea sp. LjRoot237]